MFLIKREYFNKTKIIKGLIIAILFSAFIYLAHFEIHNKIINSFLALASLYFILIASRQTNFYTGFFIGIFWFYWVSISFQYYNLAYLAPLIILFFALAYGIIFYFVSFFESIFIRVGLIFLLSYFEPFNFNWFIPELSFINSNFNTSKEAFGLILIALIIIKKFPIIFKLLALAPLYFALNLNTSTITSPNIKINMPQLNTSQEQKWIKDNLKDLIQTNLDLIEKAIIKKDDLIILPETVFPLVLNKNDFLMERLIENSYKINILVGSLYYENNHMYNATYYFSKGKFQIAKKVVLVPFGEEIPLPKFFVDLINDTFYNGAQDYKKAEKPSDFEINGIKFRNAICYEATSKEIYENLNGVKYIIAISNNAWFTPSIEPTLQKLLLKYYAKKHNVTIFHSVNGSSNYIVMP